MEEVTAEEEEIHLLGTRPWGFETRDEEFRKLLNEAFEAPDTEEDPWHLDGCDALNMDKKDGDEYAYVPGIMCATYFSF